MKKTKYPRIQTRLYLGLLIFILSSSIISMFYYRDINELNKVTNDIIEHPFTVSNSVRDIDIYINVIHRNMKDIILSENEFELNNSIILMNKNEQLIYDKFEIVKEKFLGDLKFVNEAYTTFSDWKPIRDEVIDLVKNGNIDEAAKITKEKGHDHIILLFQKTRKMIDFADDKATSFNQNSIDILQKAKRNFFLFFIGSSVIGIILFLWIFYSISNPINNMIKRIKNVSGDKMKEFPKNAGNQFAVLDFAISEFENREKILEEKVNIRTNELREARNLLESSIDNANIGITTINLEGKLLKANNYFCDFIGYSKEELLNMRFNDFTKEEDKATSVEFVKKVIEGKTKGESFDKAYVHKSGKIIYGSISTSLVKDGNNQPNQLFSQIRDITELKLNEIELAQHKSGLENTIKQRTKDLNEKALNLSRSRQALAFLLEDVNEIKKQLENSNSKLNESNTELESFSYSVSHDLRAPLRHINGYIDLITRKFPDSLPEKGRHYLAIISDSTNQMSVLIDDLLQFSRTSRKEMKRTNFDMNNLFQEVLGTIKKETIDRKIEWITSSLPNISGDYNLLTLVWYNLLSNAVKFTRKKEEARIEIGFQEDSIEFVFMVRDNGAGFDMKYASKLFGVFQRLHSTEEYEGTGIGLANVKRIIQRHGGRTWAEAELGKGATFFFTLKKSLI